MKNKLLSMALTAILLIGNMIPVVANESKTITNDQGQISYEVFINIAVTLNQLQADQDKTNTQILYIEALQKLQNEGKTEITFYDAIVKDNQLTFITDPAQRVWMNNKEVDSTKSQASENLIFNNQEDMTKAMNDYVISQFTVQAGDTFAPKKVEAKDIFVKHPQITEKLNLLSGATFEDGTKESYVSNLSNSKSLGRIYAIMAIDESATTTEGILMDTYNKAFVDSNIKNLIDKNPNFLMMILQNSFLNDLDIDYNDFSIELGSVVTGSDSKIVSVESKIFTLTNSISVIDELIPLSEIKIPEEPIVGGEIKDVPTDNIDPVSTTPEPTITPEDPTQPTQPETPSDEPKDPINPLIPAIPVVLVLGFLPFLLPPLFRRVVINGVGDESRLLNKTYYKISKNSNFIKINITEGLKLHKTDEILKIEIKDSLYKKILFGKDGKKYVIANTDTYTAKAEIIGTEGNYSATIDPNNDLIKNEIQK